MTMGEYIKTLRESKGFSQAELGRRVGVNRAAVNKWENGSVENIKRSTIKKLSEIFQVSPCELMQWDGETHQNQLETKNINDLFQQHYGKEAFTVITGFLKLDSTDRGIIIGRLEGLLADEKYKNAPCVKREPAQAS